ncbi:MAG: hypothetical protein WC763_06685 [Candidatus Paceibacterota bacterium]|jgi:hypothetical protein
MSLNSDVVLEEEKEPGSWLLVAIVAFILVIVLIVVSVAFLYWKAKPIEWPMVSVVGLNEKGEIIRTTPFLTSLPFLY